MFGMNFFNEVPRPFKTQYRCYSVSMMPGAERDDLEKGGKIILPPSALDQLTRLNIVYPMLFKLTNAAASRTTHCGVLEFVADEGKVYLPYWMMQNLALEEGGLLQVESASLPVATFAKFQPHSVDFLDLTNPKAVLESRLRNFACLSTGDVVAIHYNNKNYELSVLETKPAPAVTVIECDLNVDFAPPVGYQEPKYNKPKGVGGSGAGGGGHGQDDDEEEHMDVADLMPEPTGFVAFSGSGNRLDGRKKRNSNSVGDGNIAASPSAASSSDLENRLPRPEYVRGIPDYDYQVGSLNFIRFKTKKVANGDSSGGGNNGESSEGFEAFKGQGMSLRAAAKKK